jgi:hypothetical protein
MPPGWLLAGWLHFRFLPKLAKNAYALQNSGSRGRAEKSKNECYLFSRSKNACVLFERVERGVGVALLPCAHFLNRPQSASRWAETLEFWAEQKNGKDNNFQLVSHWVFSMLKYITKVKLLFLYRFSVLSVHLHYKLLSHDGGRARPHFYNMFLGERKIREETYEYQ